ncbi:MAG: hypothetical protein AMXMBFR53_08050 [Gemmatimonadota bacterium]
MPIRFRRSITIFPGVRLNIGKRGLSFSLGPRGASVTVGNQGTHVNVGIPGTGLSYRTKLDIPSGPQSKVDLYDRELRRPFRESEPQTVHGRLEDALRNLLADRERGAIDWHERALWLADPAPPEEDEAAFERHVRRIAAGRFARRMVEGDRAAWSEVIREELVNEALPFDVSFEWGIEEEPERIYVGLEIPSIETLTPLGLPTMKARELHEDVACGLLLRVAHEVFRVIPEADGLYLVGFRDSVDGGSGHPIPDWI